MKLNRRKSLSIIILILGIIVTASTVGFAAALNVESDNGSVEDGGGDTIVTETDSDGSKSGYTAGTDVTLTATPAAGYQFVGWIDLASGDPLTASPTDNPITFDVGTGKNVRAVYLKLEEENSSIDPIVTDNSMFPSVEFSAVPNGGYEFARWEKNGSQVSTSATTTLSITDDSTIRAVSLEGTIASFDIGPRHIVREVDVREYEFRDDARLSGYDDKVQMNFQFTGNAPSIHIVRANTNTQIDTDSSNASITYDENKGELIFANNYFDGINKNIPYEIRIGDKNGPRLATFTRKTPYAPPKIEVRINGYPQYGELEPGNVSNKVYYINNPNTTLDVDVTAQSDIADQRFIRSSHDTGPETLNRTVDLNFEWKDVSTTGTMLTELNDTITNGDWEFSNAQPFVKELNNLDSNTLQVMAVRMKASAFGAEFATDQTYYFALDSDDTPAVKSISAGVGAQDIINANDPEDRISLIQNNNVGTLQPELDITFEENKSGFESDTVPASDNIKVRAIKVDDNKDLQTIGNEYVDQIDNTFDDNVTKHFEIIDYSPSSKTATVFPYGKLKEGLYVIRVTATDLAGNTNDTDTSDTNIITGFSFILEVNESTPIINNISLRDDNGNETENIISTSGGRLQFDVYNAEDLRYQIHRQDETGTWDYESQDGLDKKTKFVNQSFSDFGIELKDGKYEVIMIADDIDIQQDLIDIIDDIELDDATDIEQDIEQKLIDQDYTLDDNRTTIRGFRFRVDGTPPTIKEVKYINPETGESEATNEDGNFGILYTATPTFQIEITDRSSLGNLDINISDILAGVIKRQTTKENNEIINKIQFTPNTPLNDGVHSIKIDVEDKWGNPQEEGDDDPYEKVFENIFETQNVAKGITFNIDSGDRLSVKEASAIEISLPADKTLDKSSLNVSVNGKLVINGKSLAAGVNGFQVISFDDWNRFILFSTYPLPSGNNEISVTVDDKRGNTTGNNVSFMVDNYREGFGFGRLGKFLLEKAKDLDEASN